MYLNANIPLIECYVRGNYLRDQKDSHDQYFKCVVFAVSSIPKQVPLFSFVICLNTLRKVMSAIWKIKCGRRLN